MMEELRVTVIFWCGILFLVCLGFLIFIKMWEKKHPQAFTKLGTQKEKQQYNQIITICVNTILAFVLFFILAIGRIGYGNGETTPIALIVFVVLGFMFIISNVISSFRKK